MTHSVETRTELLLHAARQARLAPSVHNTQPWRFVLTEDALEIHSDPRRQLAGPRSHRTAAADQLRLRGLQRQGGTGCPGV